MGMQYRTTSMAEGVFYTFWFEKNLQGDIVAVYNESGVKAYSYSYDAWGNLTVTRHSASGTNGYAVYNPFYYRGYYRDSETGFYYLQSRYYDPQMGRFLNADGQLNGGLLGCNQFAYCENNPVNYIDPSGRNAASALAWWASTTWGLTVADGPLPIGDIIYGAGLLILGTVAVAQTIEQVQSIDLSLDISMDSDEEGKKEETTGKSTKKKKEKKRAKPSHKEKADDAPSWVNKGMVDKNQTAQQNAKRILDAKYGKGGWKTGAAQEYNKIVKWIQRGGLLKGIGYFIWEPRKISFPP